MARKTDRWTHTQPDPLVQEGETSTTMAFGLKKAQEGKGGGGRESEAGREGMLMHRTGIADTQCQ